MVRIKITRRRKVAVKVSPVIKTIKVPVPKDHFLSDISGKDIGPGRIKLTFSNLKNKKQKSKFITLKKDSFASRTTANSKSVRLDIKKIKD